MVTRTSNSSPGLVGGRSFGASVKTPANGRTNNNSPSFGNTTFNSSTYSDSGSSRRSSIPGLPTTPFGGDSFFDDDGWNAMDDMASPAPATTSRPSPSSSRSFGSSGFDSGSSGYGSSGLNSSSSGFNSFGKTSPGGGGGAKLLSLHTRKSGSSLQMSGQG